MSQLERIGRYRVLKWLGAGGFASVWLGEDETLQSQVAIKLLADNWAKMLDVRDRFVEEARILRRADSDRVVRVFDIGELDDDRPYFVMAYADGGTLATRLAGGPLPVPEAVRVAVEVARAVAVLHRINVIHRDVTPSNVLFQGGHDGGERILIADLGLAKAVAHASGISMRAGTPGYMAPEQAVAGGGIDVRADVFGLGALTYHLLTGTTHDRAGDVPPSSLRTGVSSEVDAVVLRALEFDRGLRWKDAESFAATLDEAGTAPAPSALPMVSTSDEPEAVEPTAVDEITEATATEILPRGGRPPRRRLRAALAFVLVPVLGAAMALAWNSLTPPEKRASPTQRVRSPWKCRPSGRASCATTGGRRPSPISTTAGSPPSRCPAISRPGTTWTAPHPACSSDSPGTSGEPCRRLRHP